MQHSVLGSGDPKRSQGKEAAAEEELEREEKLQIGCVSEGVTCIG